MLHRLLLLLTVLSPIATAAPLPGTGSGVTLQDDFLNVSSPGVEVLPGGGYRIPYSTLMANDTIPAGSLSTTDPVIVDGMTATGGNWGANSTLETVGFGPSNLCIPFGTCSYSVLDPQGVPIPGATATINFTGVPLVPVANPDLQTFASDAPSFVIDVLANDTGDPIFSSFFPVPLGVLSGDGFANVVTLPSGRQGIVYTPGTFPPCGDAVVEYYVDGCFNSNPTTATFRIVLATGDCNANCIDDALEPDDDQDGIPNDCELPVGDANAPLCTIVNAPDETSAAGTATDNRPSEDVDNDQFLDPGEDLNGNGQIDVDSGVTSVVLLPGSVNIVLDVPAFAPGSPLVNFTLNLIDTSLPGTGVVRITDGAGNPRECPVSLLGAECHLFLGFGPGSSSTTIHGHPYVSQMSSVRWTYPVTMQQASSFLAPSSLPYATRPLRVEVHMWNPTMFPNNPQQWSQVVTIRGTPGGTNTVEYSGSSNGITIQCQFFSDANGVLRMRFPFQIVGM